MLASSAKVAGSLGDSSDSALSKCCFHCATAWYGLVAGKRSRPTQKTKKSAMLRLTRRRSACTFTRSSLASPSERRERGELPPRSVPSFSMSFCRRLLGWPMSRRPAADGAMNGFSAMACAGAASSCSVEDSESSSFTSRALRVQASARRSWFIPRGATDDCMTLRSVERKRFIAPLTSVAVCLRTSAIRIWTPTSFTCCSPAMGGCGGGAFMGLRPPMVGKLVMPDMRLKPLRPGRFGLAAFMGGRLAMPFMERRLLMVTALICCAFMALMAFMACRFHMLGSTAFLPTLRPELACASTSPALSRGSGMLVPRNAPGGLRLGSPCSELRCSSIAGARILSTGVKRSMGSSLAPSSSMAGKAFRSNALLLLLLLLEACGLRLSSIASIPEGELIFARGSTDADVDGLAVIKELSLVAGPLGDALTFPWLSEASTSTRFRLRARTGRSSRLALAPM
mmetsp:Transcript_15011/g.56953  ORF Transcript_15011/g.56953 Transcript_15011/m.56953 type:complete len:455 (-) Transcript_15011:2447-3811(-)